MYPTGYFFFLFISGVGFVATSLGSMQQLLKNQMSHEKKSATSIETWLLNRDPYTGFFKSLYMGVSENRGTPKSSILIGISIINHPFWVPLFLETPISG